MTRHDNDESLEEDGPSWYPEHTEGMTILRLDLQRIAEICHCDVVIRFHTNRMYSMTPKEYLDYFYPRYAEKLCMPSSADAFDHLNSVLELYSFDHLGQALRSV